MAAQFYPKFYTMIPAGLMVGIGAGPLWCAKCTYLTVVAEAYTTLSNVAQDVLVTRFFGLFFMFYQMAQVWGNLISSAGAYNCNVSWQEVRFESAPLRVKLLGVEDREIKQERFPHKP